MCLKIETSFSPSSPPIQWTLAAKKAFALYLSQTREKSKPEGKRWDVSRRFAAEFHGGEYNFKLTRLGKTLGKILFHKKVEEHYGEVVCKIL